VNDRWSTSYVAVSVALGESLDEALASLEGAGAGSALEPRCAALVAALRSGSPGSRARRAQALAEVLAEVAVGVRAMALS
jgi:hypothetical protein